MIPQVLFLVLLVALYPASGAGGNVLGSSVRILAVYAGGFGLLALIPWLWVLWQRAGQGSRQGTQALYFPARWKRLCQGLLWLSLLWMGWGLWMGGFGVLVTRVWALSGYPLVPQVCFLLPLWLCWLAIWTQDYRLECSVAPAQRRSPSLRHHLILQSRLHFLVLIPALGGAVLAGMLERISWFGSHPGCYLVALVAGALVLLWQAPRLMIWCLDTVPLPRGELRERLEAIAARLGLGYGEILLWRTDLCYVNAMILGVVPRTRYVLLSDVLLASLEEKQVEAVFAHEVGHGTYGHLWWNMLAWILAVLNSSALAILAVRAVGVRAPGLVFSLQMTLLLAYLLWGIPALCRPFEHQADWFAVQVLAGRKPGRKSDEVPAAQALAEGVELMNSALLRILEQARRPSSQVGWMHPSVDQRIACLEELAASPQRRAAFQQRMGRIRLAVIQLACCTLLLELWLLLGVSP